MPKSKRNKQVDLTKTKKHGIEGKRNLYNEIRSCVDTYANVFIFSVNDMRNSKMKHVREQWRHSRFFIGKNKVMAIALGRFSEEEYRPNLHKLGQQLKGQKGLLFSNQSVDEVLKFFSSYSEGDFARSGNIATEDVTLHEGPLPQFCHSLESYLRKLGLPTTLEKGVIRLVQDHVVCKNGDQLSPETARILKLLGYEMAEFQIRVEHVWSQDGTFQTLKTEPLDSEQNIDDECNGSIMKAGFKLAQDVVDLGSDDDEEEEMEVAEDCAEPEKETKDTLSTDAVAIKEDTSENDLNDAPELDGTVKDDCDVIEEIEVAAAGENGLNSNCMEPEKKSPKVVNVEAAKDMGIAEDAVAIEKDSKEGQESDPINIEECEVVEDAPVPEEKRKSRATTRSRTTHKKSDESVLVEEPEVEEAEKSKPKTTKTPRKRGKVSVAEELKIGEKDSILKLTQEKITSSTTKPTKYSPKMTRSRAASLQLSTPSIVRSARKK